MTYKEFHCIWFRALEYTPNQRESYLAACQEACTDACDADTLDAIYTMAHGGVKAVRAETGLSQAKFAAAYGIPRRTLENWECGTNDIAPYALRTLAFAVFSDRPHNSK